MTINHVALIPDGNRRWAKKRNLPSKAGHFMGAKTTIKILKKALQVSVKYLTIWASSIDNLKKRPREEVEALFEIYKRYFSRLLKEKVISQYQVRVNIFGKWKKFCPPELKEIIKKLIEKTKNNKNYILNILLAYDGIEEILEATKKLIKKQKKQLTLEDLKKHLWTGSLPPVDLVIRTGVEGDPHNSAGFMNLHTAYSQYYFTKTLYPDFTPQEFERAIENFLKRQRRLGA